MKEWRVRFSNLPGGPGEPICQFVDLEDENGKSMGAISGAEWDEEVDLETRSRTAVLVLPTWEEANERWARTNRRQRLVIDKLLDLVKSLVDV